MNQLTYRAEDEQTMFLELPKTDGLRIKGILRGSLDKPVVVIMHGRPGTGNELPYYLLARYLSEQGISSLRLFMYDFEPKTRNLIDSDLDTHVKDFDTVVSELRKLKVPKVFAVGHSYGGITILKSKTKLDGAVLWDASHGSVYADSHINDDDEEFPEQVVGNLVIGTGGDGYVDSVDTEKYMKEIGDNSDWAANKGYPLKIISAGNGILAKYSQKYIDVADEPKEHIIIEDASHQFDDSDEVVFELLEETVKWFKSDIV